MGRSYKEKEQCMKRKLCGRREEYDYIDVPLNSLKCEGCCVSSIEFGHNGGLQPGDLLVLCVNFSLSIPTARNVNTHAKTTETPGKFFLQTR